MPKSVLRAVLGRMQFTLHATRRTPHVAPRLVQAISAWSVKTRRAPSRHGRDARVYGHTTTAMHKLSTTLPYGGLGPWSDSAGRTLSQCALIQLSFSHECVKWVRKLRCLSDARPELSVHPRPCDDR